TDHTVGGLERDGADSAFADVLRHFAGYVQRLRHVVAFTGDADCGTDQRNVAFLELDVDGGAGGLDDFSYVHRDFLPLRSGARFNVQRRHSIDDRVST